MKKILPLVLFTILALNVNAQKCFKGKIEDLTELTKRKLVVVTLKEDVGYVEKLTKKIGKTQKADKKEKLEKELNDYQNQISSFNNNVKELIPTYWSLNNDSDIKYLTKDEVENYIKNESETYAVLDLTPDETIVSGYNSVLTVNHNIITYGASEKKRSKATYRNHILNVNYNFPKTRFKNKNQQKLVEDLEKEKENKPKVLSKENIIITLVIGQNYIKSVLETGEILSFSDYAKKVSEKNKKLLQGKRIMIQSAIVGSKVYKNLEEYSDRIELVSAERIAQAINNNEDVYIGLPAIKKYIKAKSGFGAGGVSVGFTSINTLDHKLVYNPYKREIISFRNAPSPLNYRSFKKKDIEELFASE
ncbi:hypothetical protein [Tenacibaculum sp. IB213877]|uniref:hypothetical protein n=1 Tax=Tenacibaculum sp. IB213877 TaxID=3097351 RepID=UPI002A5B10DC|nr:hypothetical protein [Tenacibaculum sp. IB213877]MDY0779957.1 hypothetical protein [Tenacibaculum sp. IB213877]